jgi:hypothetical protein
MPFVSTRGLYPAYVLLGLYQNALRIKAKNSKKPEDDVHSTLLSGVSDRISVFEISQIMDESADLYFGVVDFLSYGNVVLSIDLSDPNGFDSVWYDNIYGTGEAERIVDDLRKSPCFEKLVADAEAAEAKRVEEQTLILRSVAEAALANSPSKLDRFRRTFSLSSITLESPTPPMFFSKRSSTPRVTSPGTTSSLTVSPHTVSESSTRANTPLQPDSAQTTSQPPSRGSSRLGQWFSFTKT